MSVLIKGIDMPMSCRDCPCEYDGICKMTSERSTVDKRSEDCPLVEVPKHGRLIDADKLKIKWILAEERQGPDTIIPLPLKEYISNGCVYDLDNEPTVIEAEEVDP